MKSPKNTMRKIENDCSKETCNHFMVWHMQNGYSYYRCDKCDYIDGKKTFEDYIKKSQPPTDKGWEKKWRITFYKWLKDRVADKDETGMWWGYDTSLGEELEIAEKLEDFIRTQVIKKEIRAETIKEIEGLIKERTLQNKYRDGETAFDIVQDLNKLK